MLTTTPNSKILNQRSLLVSCRWLLLAMISWLLCGCSGPRKAEDFFTLTPESYQHRSLQTRMFDTSNEKELLSASAAVLQDLGFQVEESSTEVGVLRAAKERGAREYSQDILQGLFFTLSILGGSALLIPVDLHQQINAILVTRPSEHDSSRYSLRIHFYRTVWKGEGISGENHIPPGQQTMEMIVDGTIYQMFFAKLAKSVFLEAQEI